MKAKTIILTFMILCGLFISNAQATGGGGNDPYPATPNGFNNSWYYEGNNPIFSDPIPSWHWWQEYVDITCVNVTIPAGCNLNVTFQWFNMSHYFGLWITWRDAQDWSDWWEHVNWTTEPDSNNDSFWLNYSSWTGLVASQKLCEYNENVSCSTENDFISEKFYWRATAELICLGYTTTTTCTYCFAPERCPISHIYPPSPNGTACPCCDAICIEVNNELGHNMNVTIWGREDGKRFFAPWNIYNNITNGTYCFCIDAIKPTPAPHALGHSHTMLNVTLINNWLNVTYNHGHAQDHSLEVDPTTGIVTILRHGHYKAQYWLAVQDWSANPTGHLMASRVLVNGTDELEGSYREITFAKQHAELHLISFVEDEFYPGTTLRIQYIGDSTNQKIYTNGTWSSDDISAYSLVERMGSEETFPMKYNYTYYWWVNVTDTTTEEYFNSAIFQFKTNDFEDCFCGNVTAAFEDLDTSYYKAFVIGLLGLIGLAGLKKYKKEKNK